MTIHFTDNVQGNPAGKLADAELHFADGPLAGLKLIGFGIWERRGDHRRNVTFPARQYSVNGERRSFALLRPLVDVEAQTRLRDAILQAYEGHEALRDAEQQLARGEAEPSGYKPEAAVLYTGQPGSGSLTKADKAVAVAASRHED